MNPLHRLVDASVRHRIWVVAVTLLLAAVGLRVASSLVLDAFPDLTNVQVQVVAAAPGLAPEEVELLVTVPVERNLGGVPGLVQVRSKSGPGVSSITAVFEDGVDLWHARQLVRERVDQARPDLPEDVRPEVAPPSTGLGEVFQFVVSSDRHERPDLYRIVERDLAPRLRTVPGVVEVNAWGAGAPRLEARLDPWALAHRQLALEDVQAAVGASLGLASGGARAGADEQIGVRALSNPTTPEALADLRVPGPGGASHRLGDLGEVAEGGALTIGVATAHGEGEVLFGMVQLLAGADARRTVQALRERMAEVLPTLPEGVSVEVIYDREALVAATLSTVTTSLVEGGLLVVVVLLLLLGDLRAGLVVASVIPLSMIGALAGLSLLGVSGNLMSLGAVDFGLVVDGAVVVVEGIVALGVGREVHLRDAVADRARSVAGPVFTAVGILLVVYVPILTMVGVEGKLFRPMAITVLLAIGTALALTFTWVPALSSLVIVPRGHHETFLIRTIARPYERVLGAACAHPREALGASLAVLAVSVGVGSLLGVEFTPRLEEGDLVVQTERIPSISPEGAMREATRVEQVLRRFPEVLNVASRVGSPAIATDPMGMHEADVLVTLAPHDAWTTATTLDGLVDAMSAALEADAPGAALTFTQPIEMRFGEMLEGIPSDVGVEIYGPDIATLLALGRTVAERLEAIDGAADVRAPSVEGLPGVEVTVDPARAAALGVEPARVLELVQGVQRGRAVGQVTRGGWRDDVVLRLDLPAEVPVSDLPIVLPSGVAVPIAALADVSVVDRPAVVRRQDGSRRVVVMANVRGRDLGAFVADARAAVDTLDLPEGYRLGWAGSFEQLAEASRRMAIMVPFVLLTILFLLRGTFGAFRPAWLILMNVPLAVSGGLFALAARGLPISMSAMVGFIALFGIAVMNGIVLVARVLERAQGQPVAEAARHAARERFRPVLTTATVAGLGFVPMALATGVGAEVQRPLATVVLGGLLTSTLLTLVVLPAVAPWILRRAPTGPEPTPYEPGGAPDPDAVRRDAEEALEAS